jgi:MSHA biogenesis protein MshO
MIVTLVVSTIVVGFMAMFLSTPIDAYTAQKRRSDLSNSAEAIVRNIGDDVRTALPNSTRIGLNGSIVALEMLATVDVLRYRADAEVSVANRELKTNSLDAQFSTLGTRNNPAAAFAYLAVNNLGTGNADAYAIPLSTVMTPAVPAQIVPSAAVPGESDVTLNPAFNFTVPPPNLDSPSHSVFLVSGPVAYLCDSATQTLHRYTGYTIAANIAARDSDLELTGAGATSALIATNVSTCSVTRSASTKYRGDLVTLTILLTSNGENLPVFFQAAVERRP